MMEKTFIWIEETESTNDYLRNSKQAVDGGVMTIVSADYQSAGRGQRTNRWESERGKNLLFSVLVHPHELPVRRQFFLSMVGALAIKDAVDSYVGGVTLKWPNDIYCGDRKLSGTLIETHVANGQLKDCIFGVGINVNQRVFTSDAPNPVSLSQLTGREVDREELLRRVIASFERFYEMLASGDYGTVSSRYRQCLYRREGFYPFRDVRGEFEAAIVDVEDDGHLVLRDKKGVTRRYAFKEVAYII